MNLSRFGRASKPQPMASLNPLMQAHYDTDLPVWVASDHAVFGTFSDLKDGIELAERIAPGEPAGERIIVTLNGVSIHTVRGSGPIGNPASKR